MKTENNGRLVAVAVVASLCVAGCASENFHRAKRDATQADNRAVQAATDVAVEAVEPVKESTKAWVNKKPFVIRKDEFSLPRSFSNPLQLMVNPRASLRDITLTITRASGINFSFTSDIAAEVMAPSTLNGFRHEGTLKGLLDQLAAQNNVSWKYRDGTVEFYRYETRIFEIAALPGTSSFSAKISNLNSTGGASAGGGTSSSQSTTGHSTSVDSKFDLWAGIKSDIKQMLTAKGTYSVIDTLSSVTVTDTPQAIGVVENYVKAINEKRSKQILVSIQVYSVQAKTDDSIGINWDAVYNQISSKFKLSYVTNSPVSTAASSSNLGNLTAIIDPYGQSPWATSQAIFQALSTQGTTSLTTETSVVALSGTSVPVNVVKELTYLASVSTNAVVNSGTSTTLTPGTVTSGVSIDTLPLIVGKDEILLQEAIDLSTVDSIDNVSSGSGDNKQTIQTPQRSARSIVGNVRLKSGQTLVMTGFQMINSGYSQSGIGSSKDFFGYVAGGGRYSNQQRVTLVVLVTPVIVRNPTE